MADEQNRLVVKFRADKTKNEAKTKLAGRPIFDDVELVEIRSAGDRNTVKVFPAHAQHRWITNEDGEQEIETYAMRWSEQYRRFKEGRMQIQDGTPLSELPFLTEAKRAELKALNIHTAETLASLDGLSLKTLGMGGRELKNQAEAYIQSASGSAKVTEMATQIAELQAQLAALSVGGAAPAEPEAEAEAEAEAAEDDDFEASDDETLKLYIASQTGARPRGTPSHETLVRMAREASEQAAA
jgi:NACalpha-BTF3-like transcription factor